MVCGAENIQGCVPILLAWLANYMENVKIDCIKVKWFAICVACTDQLGLLPKRPYNERNHEACECLREASQNETQVIDIPQGGN